jgi:hypothetical protein
MMMVAAGRETLKTFAWSTVTRTFSESVYVALSALAVAADEKSIPLERTSAVNVLSMGGSINFYTHYQSFW